MTLLRDSFSKIVEVVLPAHCVGCGERGAYLCPRCIGALTPADPLTLRGDSFAFDSATSAFAYEGTARKAVHQLKFRNLRAIAPCMAERMVIAMPFDLTLDAVAPIPLHHSRLRERGYNQSELLANAIAEALQVPAHRGLLTRTSQSGTQVDARGAAARQANVHNAFEAHREAAGMRIALVDDVMTTGATLHAAALTLVRAGAHEVHCLTFARET